MLVQNLQLLGMDARAVEKKYNVSLSEDMFAKSNAKARRRRRRAVVGRWRFWGE
jgi:hypothetical protein